MADPIEFDVTADVDDALRDFKKLEDELEDVADSAKNAGNAAGNAGKGFQGAGNAAKGANRDFGQTRQLIGQLAQGFGSLHPLIGRVSSAVMGMTGAMGPWGIAIGAVTTALPFLIELLSEQETATINAAQAQSAYNDLLAAGADRIRELEAARERQIRAAFGVESIEELRQELQGRIQDTPEGEAPEANARRISDLQARIRQLERDQGDMSRIVLTGGDLSDAAAGVSGGRIGTPVPERRRGGGSADSAEALARLREAAAREERAAEQALAEQIIGIKQKQHEEEMRLLEARRDFEMSERERQAADAERYAEIQIEQLNRVTAQANANAEAMAETEKRLADERAEMAMGFVGIADQAGQAVLEAFGASRGQQELWAGAIQVAEAIGSYPDPVGIASHALSAALHFANAAEMGVGGGGQTVPSVDTAAASRPIPPAGDSGGGGGGSVTINYNTPMTEAQIGRLNRRNERASDRRFGRRAA